MSKLCTLFRLPLVSEKGLQSEPEHRVAIRRLDARPLPIAKNDSRPSWSISLGIVRVGSTCLAARDTRGV